MHKTTSLLAAVLALTITTATSIRFAPESLVTMVSISASSPAQVEDAEWALSRFEAAGLGLASLGIVFEDGYEACEFRQGMLRISADAVTIHVCEKDREAARRNLLHELAHVWDHVTGGVDPRTRARFLELRGLSSWYDATVDWHFHGQEQAAEIVAWGLWEHQAPIPTDVSRVGAQDPDSLAEAFRLLTGRSPLFSPEVVVASGGVAVGEPVVDGPGVYGANPEQVRVVEAAIDRFAEAGLELPPLRIYVHPSTVGCQGHPGLFDQDRSGTRIDLCSDKRFTILHELAHAWDHNTLTETTRQRFLDHTGLEVWNHHDVAWERRGVEMAANAVAWGLLATPLTSADALSYPEHLHRYTLLTGTPTPRLPAPPPHPTDEAETTRLDRPADSAGSDHGQLPG